LPPRRQAAAAEPLSPLKKKEMDLCTGVVDPDPHHFGNLDPHPHQIKILILIRIRIKVISWIRIHINFQMTSQNA
jgi:hypothetical protein